jgi:hypothetical protein
MWYIPVTCCVIPGIRWKLEVPLQNGVQCFPPIEPNHQCGFGSLKILHTASSDALFSLDPRRSSSLLVHPKIYNVLFVKICALIRCCTFYVVGSWPRIFPDQKKIHLRGGLTPDVTRETLKRHVYTSYPVNSVTWVVNWWKHLTAMRAPQVSESEMMWRTRIGTPYETWMS